MESLRSNLHAKYLRKYNYIWRRILKNGFTGEQGNITKTKGRSNILINGQHNIAAIFL